MATTTIDVTPVGMQTPEGVARVNDALAQKDARVWETTLHIRGLLDILDQKDLEDFEREMVNDARAAVQAVDAAHEAFLRAIAGR